MSAQQEVALKKDGSSHNEIKKKHARAETNNMKRKRNKSLAKQKSKENNNSSLQAHHATVQSLANINAAILPQLSQASTDFKLQRDLQRALLDLQQRDEELITAVDIGESLKAENEEIKEKIEQLMHSMHEMLSENNTLRQKVETWESSYHQLKQTYVSQLQGREEIIEQLKEELKQKDMHLKQQFETMKFQDSQSPNHSNSNNNNSNNSNNNYFNNKSQFQSELEKKLLLQIQEEQQRSNELIQNNEELLKKKN